MPGYCNSWGKNTTGQTLSAWDRTTCWMYRWAFHIRKIMSFLTLNKNFQDKIWSTSSKFNITKMQWHNIFLIHWPMLFNTVYTVVLFTRYKTPLTERTQHLTRSDSLSSQRLSVVQRPYLLLISTKITKWRCDYNPLCIIIQDLDLLLMSR